jgi:tetratricopeptide (TPR) repeat protein
LIIVAAMGFPMKKKNMFGSVLFCALICSVLSSAWPVFAQNSELDVKCSDSSGAPAQNVKVTITPLANAKKFKEKKSDAQGLAIFDKLDDGVYRIAGHKEGFAPSFFEYAMLKGSKESVELKFAAGEDKKLYFEDPEMERNSSALLKQGVDALSQGNAAEAEKLFSQSLAVNPNAADANFYYGITLLRQSKLDEGSNALKKAIAIANILKTLSAPSTADKPNVNEKIVEKAQSQLDQIPALKAEAAFKQQKFDEAAANYSEAIKNIPDRPDLYANLARALTQAKRNDEALTAVNKAIALKPEEKSYASLKDNIILRQKSAAIEKAQAVMEDGKKLLESGDAAGALKRFQEANGLIPQESQSPLWRLIGKAQAKLNNLDEAIAAFKKAIELAPADKAGDYQMTFAQFYLDNKKFEEAVDVMADAKTAGSQTPEQVLVELAAKVKDKEVRLAEAALERVIKLNPANADAYYNLGQLYYSDGKINDKRTKELLTKFVTISTDTTKIDNAKGILYMVNKRTK